MKYVKTLSLALVIGAALMAFVGSGTASATVFCKVPGTGATTGTTCPAGSAYGAGTKVKAQTVSGTISDLSTSVATIKCNSTLETETNAEEAVMLTGPEGTLTFTTCNCEVVVLHAGTLSVEWISGTHNGTARSNGTETTTTCSTIFGNVHCIYVTSNTDLGTLTGGNPAKLDVHAEIPRLATNPLCAEESLWEAEYEVTSPKPLYIAGHT